MHIGPVISIEILIRPMAKIFIRLGPHRIWCSGTAPCSHLSCLIGKHLSCLSTRYQSCLNNSHLWCLTRGHLSCLSKRHQIWTNYHMLHKSWSIVAHYRFVVRLQLQILKIILSPAFFCTTKIEVSVCPRSPDRPIASYNRPWKRELQAVSGSGI